MTNWTTKNDTHMLKILTEHLCVLQNFEEIVQRDGTLTHAFQKEIGLRSIVAFDIAGLSKLHPLVTYIGATKDKTYIVDNRGTKHYLKDYTDDEIIRDFNLLYSQVVPSAHVTHGMTGEGLHMVEVRSVVSLDNGANAPTGVGISSVQVLAESLAATRMLISLYTLRNKAGLPIGYVPKDPVQLIKDMSFISQQYTSGKGIFRKTLPPEVVIPKGFRNFIKYIAPTATESEIEFSFKMFMKAGKEDEWVGTVTGRTNVEGPEMQNIKRTGTVTGRATSETSPITEVTREMLSGEKPTWKVVDDFNIDDLLGFLGQPKSKPVAAPKPKRDPNIIARFDFPGMPDIEPRKRRSAVVPSVAHTKTAGKAEGVVDENLLLQMYPDAKHISWES